MAFEIQELVKTVRKNPVPWAIGAGTAVIGGYFVFRKNQESGYITEAAYEQPVLPEEIAAGEAKPGDVSEAQLQELLAELERSRHEDILELAELNSQFMENLSKSLESYVKQSPQEPTYLEPVKPQEPTYLEPVKPIYSEELIRQAEIVASTPSIYFQPGVKYSPEQVGTMYSFAVEEQAALSKGLVGTSKQPSSLGSSGMTMTFYPTGQVAFTPKGSKGGTSKPTTYASSALEKAVSRSTSGWTSQQVSKITGKTGTVEQQLSGMSQSQKLSTLKAAGLI